MNTPFTRNERQDLLDRYFPAYRRWQDLNFDLSVSRGAGQDPKLQEMGELDRLLTGLRDQYRANLPFLPLSRCPFSAQVLYHSLDPYGIDGLWWNYDAPVRPVENLPPTFHSITGALYLEGPPENAPFTCAPGPGLPYIVPEVLANDHMRAVLSTVMVGRHTGYAVVYFSDIAPVPVQRLNSWGMNHWEAVDLHGGYGWGSDTIRAGQFDFDISGWIKKEKLSWIRPGDGTLTLQEGLAGCPYLSLTGTKNIQRLRNGNIVETGDKEGK